MSKIRIGTRGSKLALKQAEMVVQEIIQNSSEYTINDIEIKKIKTTGDKILDKPISEIGGKALFTKEIENQLLNKKIDLAVHSLKDFTYKIDDNLCLSGMLKRADASDSIVSIEGKYKSILELPKKAIIGTSACRRKSQLLNLRPDLIIEPIRGNIVTRIAKLYDNKYDAIILATAGLQRIDVDKSIYSIIPLNDMLPAPGQGIICVEHRKNDKKYAEIADKLNDFETLFCSKAERKFIETLEADCDTPLAAQASYNNGNITLNAEIYSLDGKVKYSFTETDHYKNAENLGIRIGKILKPKLEEILCI